MTTSEQGFIGLCHICNKTLIRSLAKSVIMKTLKSQMSRDEKEKRAFVIKYLRKSLQQRTEKEREMINKICPLKNGETVVAASCGHLFHRHCIINYCSNFKLIRRHGLVECPFCRVGINSAFVTLDLRPSEMGFANMSPTKMVKVMKKRLKFYKRKQEKVMNEMKRLGWVYRVELTHLFKMRELSNETKEEYLPPLLTKWRERKRSRTMKQEELKRKANDLKAKNLSLTSLFILKMEQSEIFPEELVMSLEKIRQNESSLEKFRCLVERIETKHMDPIKGTLNFQSFMSQIVQLLFTGFGVLGSKSLSNVKKYILEQTKDESNTISKMNDFIYAELQSCQSSAEGSIGSADSIITDYTIRNNGDFLGPYDSFSSNTMQTYRAKTINVKEYNTHHSPSRRMSRKMKDVQYDLESSAGDDEVYFSKKNRNMMKSQILTKLQDRSDLDLDTSGSNLSNSEVERIWTRMSMVDTLSSCESSYTDDDMRQIQQQRKEESQGKNTLEFKSQFSHRSLNTTPRSSESEYSSNWDLFNNILPNSLQSLEFNQHENNVLKNGMSLKDFELSLKKNTSSETIDLEQENRVTHANYDRAPMEHGIRRDLDKITLCNTQSLIRKPSSIGSHWGCHLARKKSPDFILIPQYAQFFFTTNISSDIVYEDVPMKVMKKGSMMSDSDISFYVPPPQEWKVNRRKKTKYRNPSDWRQMIPRPSLRLSSDDEVTSCNFDAILSRIPLPMHSVNPHYVLGDIGHILRLGLEDLINKVS